MYGNPMLTERYMYPAPTKPVPAASVPVAKSNLSLAITFRGRWLAPLLDLLFVIRFGLPTRIPTMRGLGCQID